MGHPLKVYYPYGGKHFITLWWTHNEQNQIVISKSQLAMDVTVSRLIEEYSDLQIKSGYEVEIVAPSESLCILAAQKYRIDQACHFFRMTTNQLSNLIKDSRNIIPPPFSKCISYTAYDKSDVDYSNEDRDPNHYGCSNCEASNIQLIDLSKEDFYDLYHEKWNTLFKYKEYEDTKAIYSIADVPDDNEELWGAYPDFGHHQRGVSLIKVNTDNTSTILFYCKSPKQIDITKYQSVIDEINNKKKQATIDYKKIRQETLSNERKRDLDNFYAVFKQ